SRTWTVTAPIRHALEEATYTAFELGERLTLVHGGAPFPAVHSGRPSMGSREELLPATGPQTVAGSAWRYGVASFAAATLSGLSGLSGEAGDERPDRSGAGISAAAVNAAAHQKVVP